MKELYILGHMGCGDHILCNGLVRWYAKLYDLVQIPCYLHNYQSVEFMFRDLKNVQAVAVENSDDAIRVSKDKHCLKLGYYSDLPFNPDYFDKEFYKHADVPFEERWRGFHVDLIESPKPDGPNYAFVHDDLKRDFKIHRPLIEINCIEPVNDGHIFHNYNLIRWASEIHCINSSFLILVDSLPEFEDQQLFFHHYARTTCYPCLKKKWIIL